jgi:hypothetical protein
MTMPNNKIKTEMLNHARYLADQTHIAETAYWCKDGNAKFSHYIYFDGKMPSHGIQYIPVVTALPWNYFE